MQGFVLQFVRPSLHMCVCRGGGCGMGRGNMALPQEGNFPGKKGSNLHAEGVLHVSGFRWFCSAVFYVELRQ